MIKSVKLRAKNGAKHMSPPNSSSKALRGSKSATMSARALSIGAAAFSIAKYVAAISLIVATAVATAALVPQPLRKRVVREVKDIALLAANELSVQARALGA